MKKECCLLSKCHLCKSDEDFVKLTQLCRVCHWESEKNKDRDELRKSEDEDRDASRKQSLRIAIATMVFAAAFAISSIAELLKVNG